MRQPVQFLDLDQESNRQVLVDREEGVYLGHVSTVSLDAGKVIFAVYPRGHGRGPILMKKSLDGGKSWTKRLPTPKNWETSLETPTIHAVTDPKSKKRRLILWSGLWPARLAHSEDDGKTWSGLERVGNWGGIVVMGFVEPLKTGGYLAMFHDDGRFFLDPPQNTGRFTLYKTYSEDGLAWSFPEVVHSASDVNLCEPGAVRSPDGKVLAVLLRENSRKYNSQIIFSRDEGKSWSQPRAVSDVLTGDRHTCRYDKDGRLVITYRNMTLKGRWKGDWVAWIGKWDDLVNGGNGQYLVRLKDNLDGSDCGYPGLERMPDGTFVATTYGHWEEKKEPYILCVRFRLTELDDKSKLSQDQVR